MFISRFLLIVLQITIISFVGVLTGCKDGSKSGNDAIVSPTNAIYLDAGTNQTEKQKTIVLLTGAVSGNGLVSTLWTQLKGTKVNFETLNNPPRIRFTTPDVKYPEDLIFRLTAIDENSNFAVSDVTVSIELEDYWIKYNAEGPLLDSATVWDCIAFAPYGVVTAMYSVTNRNGGPLDMGNRYTWQQMSNDLDNVNKMNLCGFDDWEVLRFGMSIETNSDYLKIDVPLWLNQAGSGNYGRALINGAISNATKDKLYNVRYYRKAN